MLKLSNFGITGSNY